MHLKYLGLIKYLGLAGASIATAAVSQPAPGVRLPPEIGAAYGRLGKAIVAHDSSGVKAVWAEDFVVNSPTTKC
jgi:hypothetical protein